MDIAAQREYIKSYFNTPNKVEVTNDFKGHLSVVFSDDVTTPEIHFKNCIFETINFTNLKLNKGITFTDCTIYGDIEIIGLFTQNFIEDPNDHSTYSLKFYKTQINGNLLIDGCKLNRSIIIEHCNHIKSLNILRNKLTNGDIKFCNSNILENSEISFNGLHNDISFYESVFESRIHLTSNHCSSLVYHNSNFKKETHVFGGEAKNGIIFDGGIYKEFYIQTVKSDGILSINGTEFLEKLDVKYFDSNSKLKCGCPEIYINDCTIGNESYIKGSENHDNPYSIKSVIINCTDKQKGKFEFLNFSILTTELTGDNNKGNIKFEHTLFKELKLNNFINSFKLQFFDIKAQNVEDTNLVILKSNLDNTEFYNCDLKSFKKVLIQSSILYKIIGSNVTWFEKDQLNPIDLALKESFGTKWNNYLEKEWKNNREIFRQLKLAMENQGNRINSLEFKSYEMEAYKQELLNNFPKNKKKGDRVIMFLSQSNDYGLNFLKPARYIVLVSFTTYCLIVAGISPKLTFQLGENFEDVKITCNELIRYGNSWFTMFNPLFDLEKTFVVEKTSVIPIGVGLITMLYRIILSYLLFQLVSAFRKFVK